MLNSIRRNLKPFLKWVGGKTQLLDRLLLLAPKEYNTYYEPFVGGGAMLLALQPRQAVVGDMNSQLINAYQQIRDRPADVIDYIQKFDAEPCTSEIFCNRREQFNNKIREDKLDVESAALMIWVNKHCFNGLYRVNSLGVFNVPWNSKRTGPSVSLENLKAVSDYLGKNKIIVRNSDFEVTCRDIKKGDFVYFDSPYMPVSQTANFTSYQSKGFTEADHKRLAEFVKKLDKLGVKVMLSNNNVPAVKELYKDFHIIETDVSRSINCVGNKRTGAEVIILNY